MSANTTLSPDDLALLARAREARERAYAPYSSFCVGAAVRAGGEIFVGCNVENVSYGLAICAERAALFAAIAAGHRQIDAVAVAGPDATPCSPCGACRQVLAEFNPDTIVLYASAEGPVRATLAQLLPDFFSAKL